jgi:hypothetical protein
MKFKIILMAILILLMLLPFSFSVAHCWDLTGFSSIATQNWNAGYHIPVDFELDGVPIELIVLPGAQLTIDISGSMRFSCDNGADRTVPNTFARLSFDEDGNYFTNSSQGTAIGSDKEYCNRRGGGIRKGATVGIGDRSQIIQTFTDIPKWIGTHTYTTEVLRKPIARTYGSSPETKSTASGTFLFSPLPTIAVFSEADVKQGFFNAQGDYVRPVFFTLNSRSVLDLKLHDYDIICPGAKSCSVDKSNVNFVMTPTENIMMITGEVIIDKANLPTEASYYLELDYGLVEIDAGINDFTANSNITKMELGLLDQQDFQVEIIGANEFGNCVGLDGVIGLTGEDVAPRINLGFGGPVDLQESLVSLDECDSSNPNWVYCSEREFLVEMTRKTAEIFSVKKRALEALAAGRTEAEVLAISNEEAEFASFNINARDLDLSSGGITNALDGFDVREFNLQNSGLNLYTDEVYLGGISTDEQVRTMRSLFSTITFSDPEGILTGGLYPVGEYEVVIDLDIPEDISELILFNASNQMNSDVSIDITLKKVGQPLEDWFFYDNRVGDVFETDVTIDEPDYYIVNDERRGVIFEFTQDNTTLNLDDSSFYKMQAVPLFIKLENVGGDINNSYSVDFDLGLTNAQISNPQDPYAFTYWNGFASSLGGGCEDISIDPEIDPQPLLFNFPDSILLENSTKNVYLYEFENSKADNVEYLETVLYLPNWSVSTPRRIITPFNVYTKDSSCNASTTGICETDISTLTSDYSVSTLQELFDGIKDEQVCVASEKKGSNTDWTLFWNAKKIKSDLDTKKDTITDAIICGN